MQKESEFFDVPVKSDNSNTGRKSFCFCTESNQQVSMLSQRLCLAQTLIKTPKTQYIQRDICANTPKQKAKSKKKIIRWVASQQALSFYAPS